MLDFARIAVRLRYKTKRYEFDERTERLALERLVELIGEAAKRVSTETRESQARIEWSDIIKMRDKLAHDYDEIDPDILWGTFRNDLPRLIRQLESALSGRH
jgi:uncharacterized protein with HEPN domain